MGCDDQFFDHGFACLLAPAQLHMPHVFPRALQQAGWVLQIGAMEKADIGVGAESGDIRERRVPHTGGGAIVMQDFAYIGARASHLFKPGLNHLPQLVPAGEPSRYGRIALYRAVNTEQRVFHDRAVSTTHSITATPIQWVPSISDSLKVRPANMLLTKPESAINPPSRNPKKAPSIKSERPA